MNLQELGALLKRERERRGMSLRDVMDTTKISRRNLSALEEGQVNLLPHPVYLKGYIKNYARLLGLDADRLTCVVDQQCSEDMESYLPQEATAQQMPSDEEFRHPAPAAEPAMEPGAAPAAEAQPEGSAEAERKATAPSTSPFMAPDDQPKTYGSDPLVPEKPRGGGMLRTFLILVTLVALLGGLLYYYQISYTAPEPAKPAPAPEPAPLPAPVPADNASDALNATAAEATPEPQAIPQGAIGGALPASRTSGLGEPAVAPAQPAAPAALGSIVVEKPKGTTAAAQPAKPAPAPAPAASAPAPGMQELTIAAKPGEICWVQFNDGSKNKNFTLQPGEVRKLEFARYARVRLGNAGGVSFSVNGQPHPYQGQRGSIDVVEFGSR